jgi:hypothetical protein
MNKKTLVFEISGGLGNQLFQLAALNSYAIDFGLEPVVNLSKLSKGNVHREFTVPIELYRILTCQPSNFRFDSGITLWLKRAIWKIESTFPGIKLRNVYNPKAIGFSPESITEFNYKIISGYFQSYRYPDKLGWKNKLNEFSPTNRNFIRFRKEILQVRPIAIHVRGQDYLNDSSGIGNLQLEYFATALEKVNKPNKKIWVFTDDIRYARRILSPLESDFLIVDEAQTLSAIETMYLMATAPVLIISNSTFSWWAAYISSDAQVYAPKKWFQNMDDPLDLIPPDWHRLESIWIN